MDRKKAIGLASSVSIAAAGAVVAIGANFGLFGLAASASAPPLPVSVTEPAAVRQEVANLPAAQQVIEETRVIDVPVHVPAPSTAVAPSASASDREHDDDGPASASAPTTSHDDDSSEVEHRDDRRADACETHDDGKVECHDEDD